MEKVMNDNFEKDPVILRVMGERNQEHPTRVPLFKEIEKYLDCPLITFFTSFDYPVSIEDDDIDIFAGLLQMLDLSNGLALMISSPGGSGLAAERLINICKNFSKTDEYIAIVPGKAKSAATMICFGASKILMGPTSELGPVDPQVVIKVDDVYKLVPAYHIVKSYETLFYGAIKEKGNLEPYLQQLQRYDSSIIEGHRSAIELSKDISVRALNSGMMSDLTENEIRKKIQIFLNPDDTKTHGRPLFQDKAKECSLNIEGIDPDSEFWRNVYELYFRTNSYVSREVAKCIETKDYIFVASPPR
jgi:hypothetical protein